MFTYLKGVGAKNQTATQFTQVVESPPPPPPSMLNLPEEGNSIMEVLPVDPRPRSGRDLLLNSVINLLFCTLFQTKALAMVSPLGRREERKECSGRSQRQRSHYNTVQYISKLSQCSSLLPFLSFLSPTLLPSLPSSRPSLPPYPLVVEEVLFQSLPCYVHFLVFTLLLIHTAVVVPRVWLPSWQGGGRKGWEWTRKKFVHMAACPKWELCTSQAMCSQIIKRLILAWCFDAMPVCWYKLLQFSVWYCTGQKAGQGPTTLWEAPLVEKVVLWQVF